MKQSQVTKGVVVTIGHPANEHLAVCTGPGEFRWLNTGTPVDNEDFRSGWDLYVPTVHPELLDDYQRGFAAQAAALNIPTDAATTT